MKNDNIATSPQRHMFTLEKYLERLDNNPGDQTAQNMVDFLLTEKDRRREIESDPEWQKNNMEYDLRTSQYIIDKVQGDVVYAQNLYAAMCNNNFIRNDVWPLLTGETWSCSWRYAGGIVADMKGEGDYIEYYCSGIGNGDDLTDEQFNQLDYEAKEYYINSKRFVNESVITEEIREDLFKIGWIQAPDNNGI
jgi:hypothetical protein